MSMSSIASPPRTVPSIKEKPRQEVQRGPLLKANFRAALKALKSNGTRSFLTMLGVIIGVAAVITTVTQTEGTSQSINQRFASLGTDILTVMPGPPPNLGNTGKGVFQVHIAGSGGQNSTLTPGDAQALATLPHVVQVDPEVSTNEQAIYQDENGTFQVYGVSTSYQTIHSLKLAEGSWFSEEDQAMAAPDVVIGTDVAQNLFQPLHIDPIGKTIRIGSALFRVVGVLASTDPLTDGSIYAALSTVQVRLVNTNKLDQIAVLVDDVNDISLVQQEIKTLLEQRHNILNGKDDFWTQSTSQFVQNQQASQASLATLLIGIAAVSLTVGGIGIMNIMLVAVSERTREIGVRMAMGARKSDIRNQFLIEAVVLSALGGAIGVFFGLFIGYQIVTDSQLPFIVDPGAILLAVGVAGLTGVIFGLYPAVRASELDPIVALRTA
jgi:putative ABC transport system permease protein